MIRKNNIIESKKRVKNRRSDKVRGGEELNNRQL